MNLDDTFHFMTTIVQATVPDGGAMGTAFFYQHLAEKEEEGPQWREVQGTWLVTNRHVVLPLSGDEEQVPSAFQFNLREVVGDKLTWSPVVLAEDELRERCRLHPDPRVDVAVIDVGHLLIERVREEDRRFLPWYAVHPEQLPGGGNKISIQASDDVLVVGYPRGFYDRENLYPIVKSGIIASRWGAHFDGEPFFLIDAKLFPGSSGSAVISKPVDFLIHNGAMLHAKRSSFPSSASSQANRTRSPNLLILMILSSFVVLDTTSASSGTAIWWKR